MEVNIYVHVFMCTSVHLYDRFAAPTIFEFTNLSQLSSFFELKYTKQVRMFLLYRKHQFYYQHGWNVTWVIYIDNTINFAFTNSNNQWFPLKWTGVSATWRCGRYTLSYRRGEFNVNSPMRIVLVYRLCVLLVAAKSSIHDVGLVL